MSNNWLDSAAASKFRLPRVLLMIDALVVLVCLLAGMHTGEHAYLIAALGLAVLAPLWFRHPVSLTMPISDMIRQHPRHTRVDAALTILGAGLLAVSAVMIVVSHL